MIISVEFNNAPMRLRHIAVVEEWVELHFNESAERNERFHGSHNESCGLFGRFTVELDYATAALHLMTC